MPDESMVFDPSPCTCGNQSGINITDNVWICNHCFKIWVKTDD